MGGKGGLDGVWCLEDDIELFKSSTRMISQQGYTIKSLNVISGSTNRFLVSGIMK